MNILITLNKKYLPYLISLIRSIQDHHNCKLVFYIFSSDLTYNDLKKYKNYLLSNNDFKIIKIDNDFLNKAPVSKRYPLEMYYRIFASKFLPNNIDRILYLDPDIIVKENIDELYYIDFKNNFFAGSTNVKGLLKRFNQLRTGVDKKHEYINTGVLMMNLSLLRNNQNENEIYNFIKKKKHFFMLPDQDIISALYGDKIILIDRLIYNLSDRTINRYNRKLKNIYHQIDINWVEKNTKIIHYFGKNKPWNKNYKGILKKYYDKYAVKNND